MKGKFKKLIEKRYFVVILILLLMLLISVGATYAWFTWSSTSNTSLTMTIKDVGDVIFSGGPDINTNDLSPVFNYSDGKETSIQIINKNTTENSVFTISINITTLPTELKNESLKYAIVNVDNNNTVVAIGDFSTYSAGNSYLLYSNDLPSGTSNYKFYLYIDANIENNLNMMNKTFAATIVVGGTEGQTLTKYISNLYTNNKDSSLITRDGISYRYASSVRLMNDRFGSMSTGEGNGNIRYYGSDNPDVSDDLKNYIYFNCDTYPSSSCEPWRIIGLFKDVDVVQSDGSTTKQDLVKIIKDESIGSLAWDQDKNIDPSITDSYSSSWYDASSNTSLKNSSLNLFLNTAYFNRGEMSLYIYYSDSIGGTTSYLNLSQIGLKNNETRSKIANVLWYLGGSMSGGLYANDIYNYERTNSSATVLNGNPFTSKGHIGLMYTSDYSYGTDLSLCTSDIFNYSTACRSNDWLFNSTNEWLITPNPISNDFYGPIGAWHVDSDGYINDEHSVYNSMNVRPVLYLKAGQIIDTGDGSKNNPFKLR